MFAYHFIPENMQGTVLYPLNKIKHQLPQIFESQNAKYTGRENVQQTVVPGLGTWNDVIHLSPIHPYDLMGELKKAGASTNFTWKAYKVNLNQLDHAKLLIMIPTKKHGKFERIFLPFTKENFDQNSSMPGENKQYFRDEVAAGRQPLNYAFAPHILYKGSIDTKELEVIRSSR